MNELSTNIKTHVIITYNNSHHFITIRQNEALKNMGKDDRIEIDGTTIKGGNISEVMTLEKYYETYPEKELYKYGQPAKNESYFNQEGHASEETLNKLRELKKKILGR